MIDIEEYKQKQLFKMKNLENWVEVAKGIFRFTFTSNSSYEIIIKKCFLEDPILEWTASLYIASEYSIRGHDKYFTRTVLLKKQSVNDCLLEAVRNFKKAEIEEAR